MGLTENEVSKLTVENTLLKQEIENLRLGSVDIFCSKK